MIYPIYWFVSIYISYVSDVFLVNDNTRGDVHAVVHCLSGIAAATMFTPEKMKEVSETQLRVAFDGDAVLFSDESERIFKAHGLDKFFEHEKAHENKPLDHVQYTLTASSPFSWIDSSLCIYGLAASILHFIIHWICLWQNISVILTKQWAGDQTEYFQSMWTKELHDIHESTHTNYKLCLCMYTNATTHLATRGQHFRRK